jgi:two-component system, NarL family, nitrate/nitrite response regulator NarL
VLVLLIMGIESQKMPAIIRIAIIDDHELMRRGLRETFNDHPGFEVLGEGENAADAVELARAHQPDIMLLDINMPGGGIEALEPILAVSPSTKPLMLTVYDNMANVRTAMGKGAYGYVLKGIDGVELVNIVRSVQKGHKYVGPELAAKLLAEPDQTEHANGSVAASGVENMMFSTLTKRERQILELIAVGSNNADIARQLELSEQTVKHYITPLFRKLNVRNRTEASIKARSL